jgi:hypothetical protein
MNLGHALSLHDVVATSRRHSFLEARPRIMPVHLAPKIDDCQEPFHAVVSPDSNPSLKISVGSGNGVGVLVGVGVKVITGVGVGVGVGGTGVSVGVGVGVGVSPQSGSASS